jgi:hypothetical protein
MIFKYRQQYINIVSIISKLLELFCDYQHCFNTGCSLNLIKFLFRLKIQRKPRKKPRRKPRAKTKLLLRIRKNQRKMYKLYCPFCSSGVKKKKQTRSFFNFPIFTYLFTPKDALKIQIKLQLHSRVQWHSCKICKCANMR